MSPTRGVEFGRLGGASPARARGSGSGPGVDPVTGLDCLPVLPANPIEPIVATTGLDNRLLTRDDQKFKIKLANDAVIPPELMDDECELANLITPRLVYEIDVDSPAGQFLVGLDDNEYILDPGASVEFEVSMVPMKSRLPACFDDQLYGATIT